MPDPVEMLVPGTSLADRYRVENALGRGGMGSVYTVFDEIVGEKVALKLLAANDASSVERFKAELRLARRVTHKNIGRTFDLGRDRSSMFITMELVLGESLRAVMIRRGAMPQEELGAVLTQVCAGLAAAHEAGVVHRDLKPSNILVEPNGRVVIIDFGISARKHENLDGAGNVSGTYDYMSPEQVRGGTAEPSDDVYAIGLIAYEAATLRRPFEGPDAKTRAIRRVSVEPDLAPLARTALGAIVAACLARDPSARPHATDLEQRFRALAGDASTTTIEPKLSTPLREAVDGRDDERTVPSHHRPLASLAVTSFEVVGEDEAFGLGPALAEEISDALAQSKGLRVLSANALREAPSSTFTSMKRELGLDYVVSGTIVRNKETTGITVRLVATETGEQAWTGRFSPTSGQWAGVGAQVAVRIAEALRLELELLTSGPTIAPSAAMAFLEGRRIARAPAASTPLAVEALDRCLAEAPDFPLAVAARAVAVVRTYVSNDITGRDWAEEAASSVARAIDIAPHSPDAHYAAALLALARTEFAHALHELGCVLKMAPTHALAHETLGRIECESGKAELGMERLALALEIDPVRRNSLCMVARAHALRGRLDECVATLRRMSSLPGNTTTEESILAARVAVWFRDRDMAAMAIDSIPAAAGHRAGSFKFVRLLAGFVLGETTYWDLHETHNRILERPIPPRFRATVHQIAAEYEASLGDPLEGLRQVEQADANALIDVEWMERCPALDILRDEERFLHVQQRVRERAAALWTDGTPSPPLPASR